MLIKFRKHSANFFVIRDRYYKFVRLQGVVFCKD